MRRCARVAACVLFPAWAAAQPVAPPPAEPAAQPGGALALPSNPELDNVLADIQAELARLAGQGGPGGGDEGLPADWPDLTPLARAAPIRQVVHPADRSITVLTALLRHTVLLLPVDERIVDYVVGDALFFDVRGADNVAYVKAMAPNRRTQLSLVTDRNRAYSFDLFSTAVHRPDEVLTILWEPERAPSDGDVGAGLVAGFDEPFVLDFAPAERVTELRRRIGAAEADQRRIEADAQRQLRTVEELAERRFTEFLRAYPRRLQFRYRLTPEIQEAPLFITQIWTDGQFTYLRSSAQESPAIYTLSGIEGEEPVLVNVELSPAGLYVIDHVVGAGFAQLHGARGEWFLWDVPPLGILPEIVEQGLPPAGRPPAWIPTRASRSWFRRHPKLFGWLVASGVGGSIVLSKVF